MSLGHATWQGRRKRIARRFANDFRMMLPLLGLGLCLALSATAIAVTDGRIPAPRALATIGGAESIAVQSALSDATDSGNLRDPTGVPDLTDRAPTLSGRAGPTSLCVPNVEARR